MNLPLKRKLVLLVCIPLAGATIFATWGMTGRVREDLALRDAEATVELTALLRRVREAALREQRDSWNLYRDPLARAAFAGDTDATVTAAQALGRALAAAPLEHDYGPDGAQALRAVVAAAASLAEARTYFRDATAGADPAAAAAREMRGRYAALSTQLLKARTLLNRTVEIVPLRTRLDGIIWFGRVAQAAEDERIEIEHGFDEAVPTVAAMIRAQHAASLRQYYESNLVLMAPPELVPYWNALLADSRYQRVGSLTTEIFNVSLAESRPFNAGKRTEWRAVTQARAELLDSIEPHLLGDLRTEVARRRETVERELGRGALALLALFVVSAAVAAGFIHRIQRRLSETCRRLEEGIAGIGLAVNGLRAGAERLAAGAAQEATGLERTNASLASLTSGNELVVSTARQTVDQMQQTMALVANSRQAMESVTKTMTEISDSSNATSRIVQTIDEISFQTNLLAFNASIEAATAGSAGAGFTVVSEEVRQLAKRASEATAETDRLIEDAHAAIATGVALNSEVEAALRDVDANASRASELMQNIHAASSQMLQSMQHLGTGSRSLDTVTQQNAAIADHNAGTASAIAEETQRLHATLRKLERQLLGSSLGETPEGGAVS